MRHCGFIRLALLVALGLPVGVPGAGAAGRPAIAALQVALRQQHVYGGTVDGVAGRGTTAAVMRFQQRHGLTPNGVVGPATRRALGTFARYRLGSRPLSAAMKGWDVAALQFALAWHGFPNGTIDGSLGSHALRALVAFQRWAHLSANGIAGPETVRALRGRLPRCPLPLAWPLQAPIGDTFGPRGARFHSGVDLLAQAGTPVGAAAGGRVVFAGPSANGYGRLLEIAHAAGVVSMYAHLATVSVRVGQSVRSGSRVGRVGSSGEATGPHLHFEVRVRGAAVDPLPALG
jgi:Peptidase family M23/Putative peptidoglycan binding domain